MRGEIAVVRNSNQTPNRRRGSLMTLKLPNEDDREIETTMTKREEDLKRQEIMTEQPIGEGIKRPRNSL